MASSRKIIAALLDENARETEPLLAVSHSQEYPSYFDLLPIECFHHIEMKLDEKSFFSLARTSKKIADKMGLNEKKSKSTLNTFIYYNQKYHDIDQQYKYTRLSNIGKIVFGVSIIGFALMMELLICLKGEDFNNAIKMDKDDYFRSAIYVLGSVACGMIGLGGVAAILFVKKLTLLSEKREVAERGNDLLWGVTLKEIVNPKRGTPARTGTDSDEELDLMEQGLRIKK